MDLARYTCRLKGCDGPRSGVCINNLKFDECPDVIPLEEAEAVAAAPAAEALAISREMVQTGGGRSLDAVSCDALLRARGGTVVGLVAGPEVGKTTMIATIYELVHRGRLPGFRFAGSETLCGYEERCHLARLASNGVRPDTRHTPTAEQLSFIHLRLATASGIRDVIFSDRSGEHFDNVLAQPAGIVDFAELGRADTVLLLIDLLQLLKSPHQPTSQTRRLFMAMDQHGLLDGKPVRLIGTKADLATSSTMVRRANTALTGLADDLGRRSTNGATVTPLSIASRPRRGSTQIGEGLQELMKIILIEKDPPHFTVGTAWPDKATELDALVRRCRS